MERSKVTVDLLARNKTLREEYAGLILASFLNRSVGRINLNTNDFAAMINWSVNLADTLIKALNEEA